MNLPRDIRALTVSHRHFLGSHNMHQRKRWLVSLPLAVIMMFWYCLVYWRLVERETIFKQSAMSLLPVDKASERPPFRMLLGIFSVDTAEGKQHRDVIRRTYLSLPQFLQRQNIATIPFHHARICSLDDYWHEKIPDHERCELLYTFVLGAAKDPTAPMRYLVLQPDRPITVNISSIPDHEPDVTYLNIQENMNDGKTPTWFKYASHVLPESLQIDFFAKVDSDCIVHPPKLLRDLEERISVGNKTYGGYPMDNDNDHHYMSGGFYFLSRRLAKLITAVDSNWLNVASEVDAVYKYKPEDVVTGQMVKFYGGDNVERPLFTYVHDSSLKEEQNFLDCWDRYCDYVIAQDFLIKAISKHKTKCLSTAILAEEKRVLLSNASTAVLTQIDEMTRQLIKKCESLSPPWYNLYFKIDWDDRT